MEKVNQKSVTVVAIAVGLSLAGSAGAANLGGITIDKDGKAMVAGVSVDEALPSKVNASIKKQQLAAVCGQPCCYNWVCKPPAKQA